MHDTVAYETFFVGAITIDYSREIDMFLGNRLLLHVGALCMYEECN